MFARRFGGFDQNFNILTTSVFSVYPPPDGGNIIGDAMLYENDDLMLYENDNVMVYE